MDALFVDYKTKIEREKQDSNIEGIKEYLLLFRIKLDDAYQNELSRVKGSILHDYSFNLKRALGLYYFFISLLQNNDRKHNQNYNRSIDLKLSTQILRELKVLSKRDSDEFEESGYGIRFKNKRKGKKYDLLKGCFKQKLKFITVKLPHHPISTTTKGRIKNQYDLGKVKVVNKWIKDYFENHSCYIYPEVAMEFYQNQAYATPHFHIAVGNYTIINNKMKMISIDVNDFYEKYLAIIGEQFEKMPAQVDECKNYINLQIQREHDDELQNKKEFQAIINYSNKNTFLDNNEIISDENEMLHENIYEDCVRDGNQITIENEIILTKLNKDKDDKWKVVKNNLGENHIRTLFNYLKVVSRIPYRSTNKLLSPSQTKKYLENLNCIRIWDVEYLYNNEEMLYQFLDVKVKGNRAPDMENILLKNKVIR